MCYMYKKKTRHAMHKPCKRALLKEFFENIIPGFMYVLKRGLYIKYPAISATAFSRVENEALEKAYTWY